MTPMEQTLLTVVCMFGSYMWGKYQGTLLGIERCIYYFIKEDLLNEKGRESIENHE